MPSQQQLSPTPCSTAATQSHKHALSGLEAVLSLVDLLLLYDYNCHNCILDILILQALVTGYSPKPYIYQPVANSYHERALAYPRVEC